WNQRELYSLKLVSYHFWISTIGIVLYITSMWISGIMQGLMWRAYDHLGFLQYSFVETVEAMHPFYVVRALGGVLFLIASLIRVYNVWRTIRGDVSVETREALRQGAVAAPAPAEWTACLSGSITSTSRSTRSCCPSSS